MAKKRLARKKRLIPVLTDAVLEQAECETAGALDAAQLAGLRAALEAELTSRIHALMDELMRAASEQLSDLLRQELPVLIESILRERMPAERRKPD